MKGDPSFEIEAPKLMGQEQKVTNALESGDVDFIMYTLSYLNYCLMKPLLSILNGGGEIKEVELTGDFGRTYDENMPDGDYPSLRRKVEEFVANSDNFKKMHLYLGDGGGSRLAVEMRDGKCSVNVSNTSRQEVKDEWEKIK
jgi:hypothetical protein